MLLNTINPSKAHDDAHLLIGKMDGVLYRRADKTESYVAIPPARLITDPSGAVWTLGYEFVQRGWRLEFNVLRNDKDMGQMAERIEMRGGVVRLYGKDGTRTWNGRFFF